MPRVTLDQIETRIVPLLVAAGLREDSARIIARTITVAERDGTKSHGLMRLRGCLSSLKSGWINGHAVPKIDDSLPAVVRVDADHGFAQVALAAAAGTLMAKARRCGSATLFTRNSHHCAALWPDLEPFAEQNFVGLTSINTRSRMTAWEGTRPALGTSPVAFACPRGNGRPPVIWDQSASVMSHGDLMLASKANRDVDARTGLNADGQPTTSASEILNGGVLLPFGGPKGASIAFMAEILSAACAGGEFGFEDKAPTIPGATTTLGNQFVLLIDVGVANRPFAERIEDFVAAIQAAGSQRLPGTKRYAHRREALKNGVDILSEDFELLGLR